MEEQYDLPASPTMFKTVELSTASKNADCLDHTAKSLKENVQAFVMIEDASCPGLQSLPMGCSNLTTILRKGSERPF